MPAGAVAVRHQLPVWPERDHAADERQHLLETMLDQHHRRCVALDDAAQQVDHQRGPLWIEVGGRLIEQDQAGTQSQHSRDGQPLLLAARQMRRRAVAAVREPNRIQRRVNARPDGLSRNAPVLEAERDVVTGTPHDQLTVGVLEHDGDAVPRVDRWAAVEQEAPL